MAIPFEMTASHETGKTSRPHFPAPGRTYRIVRARSKKHPMTQINSILYTVAGVLSVACIAISMVVFWVACFG